VTTALITPMPHIELLRTYVLLLTILTTVIFLVFSPNMDRETTTMNHKYYPAMKIISVTIVLSNFIFLSDVIALAFLLQGILILPILKGGERT